MDPLRPNFFLIRKCIWLNFNPSLSVLASTFWLFFTLFRPNLAKFWAWFGYLDFWDLATLQPFAAGLTGVPLTRCDRWRPRCSRCWRGPANCSRIPPTEGLKIVLQLQRTKKSFCGIIHKGVRNICWVLKLFPLHIWDRNVESTKPLCIS